MVYTAVCARRQRRRRPRIAPASQTQRQNIRSWRTWKWTCWNRSRSSSDRQIRSYERWENHHTPQRCHSIMFLTFRICFLTHSVPSSWYQYVHSLFNSYTLDSVLSSLRSHTIRRCTCRRQLCRFIFRRCVRAVSCTIQRSSTPLTSKTCSSGLKNQYSTSLSHILPPTTSKTCDY